MAYDTTTIESQITSVQAAITAALTNPRPNWKVGQVALDQGDYLNMLFKQQDLLFKQLRLFPVEDISTSQHAITPLGQDLTDYQGEPND